jgi:hypothetical protein
VRQTAQLGKLETSQENVMTSCPHKNCKFKTNVSDRLQHHFKVSGHGATSRSKREFRGDMAQKFKKKK